MAVQALPVSGVMSILREMLEQSEFLSDLWVHGEITSLTRSQAGHRYFSLKDPGATLRSVLFARTQPAMTIASGDGVLAHGRISVYPPRGDLQFIVDFIRPEGVGILAARFEQLRERLGRDGLFAPERKRPLPAFPRRIGVVTSPTGAAIHDILTVIERRWPLATVVFAPAQVQGDQAPLSLVSALRRLGRTGQTDLIILARGGGSADDLWAFNDERLARAIFASPVPVVSGVGHETDVTIADLVADVRAPTPTGAAELVTPDGDLLYRAIGNGALTLQRAIEREISARRFAGESQERRLRRCAPEVGRLRQSIDSATRAMGAASALHVARHRDAIEGFRDGLPL